MGINYIIKKEKAFISFKDLLRIAKILDISVDELFQ